MIVVYTGIALVAISALPVVDGETRARAAVMERAGARASPRRFDPHVAARRR